MSKPPNTKVINTVVELPVYKSEFSKAGSPFSDHLSNTPEIIGGVYINGKKRRSVARETVTLGI